MLKTGTAQELANGPDNRDIAASEQGLNVLRRRLAYFPARALCRRAGWVLVLSFSWH